MAKALMLQGTSSHVGKSILAAAFCRLFWQDGLKVAPFKAQNMSLNAAVTPEGAEIGRAQALQAAAAGVAPQADMNPILLKPKADTLSQVVMLGKPVVEGAGSPAEVNLKSRDLANMTTAELTDASVLLIADIERGGVFGAMVGTLDLLEPHERARVKGLLINKFRGDASLFADGARWLEERTGIPVLGVIPYLPDLGLDEEDSVGLPTGLQPGTIDVAVIRLPRIANFNDFDPLAAEEGVGLRYVDRPEQLGYPDAVILPGTKNTVDDLRWLYARGLAGAIDRLARAGVPVAGICGGYQMLGEAVRDEQGIESLAGVTPGLGLLPVMTEFAQPDKRTLLVSGRALGAPVTGYEVHMGRTDRLAGGEPLVALDGGGVDGCIRGEVWGTYLHGIFESGPFRRRWLNSLRARRGLPPLLEDGAPHDPREAALNRLADHVRRHLDVKRLYAILDGVAP